jgi:hypothetical protein
MAIALHPAFQHFHSWQRQQTLDSSSLRKGISLTIAEEREKRLAAKQRWVQWKVHWRIQIKKFYLTENNVA